MTHEIDIHVGAEIRKARIAQKVSQIALAEAIGTSFQQVQKYESGANRISASRLAMAAVRLNMPVADFFPAHIAQPDRPAVETELLEVFRCAAPAMQEAIVRVAAEMSRAAAA